MIRLVLLGAVLVLIAIAVMRGGRSIGSVFEIRTTQTDFIIRGDVPERFRPNLKRFLNELKLPDRAVIRAVRRNGTVEFEFSRNIDELKQQQFRNFLYSQ